MAKTKTDKYQLRYEDASYTVESPSHRDKLTFNYWAKGRFYEGRLLEAIRDMNLRGAYVDVGANLGNHSIFFANHCPCSHLYSIEAVPQFYKIMVRNVHANNQRETPFTPMNFAAHDRRGMLATWDPIDERNLGGTRMEIRERELSDTYPKKNNNRVITNRLDEAIPITEKVAVLKLDIEGGEIPALAGAIQTIATHRPLIVAEALNYKALGQLDEFLAAASYRRLSGSWKKNTYIWRVR